MTPYTSLYPLCLLEILSPRPWCNPNLYRGLVFILCPETDYCNERAEPRRMTMHRKKISMLRSRACFEFTADLQQMVSSGVIHQYSLHEVRTLALFSIA